MTIKMSESDLKLLAKIDQLNAELDECRDMLAESVENLVTATNLLHHAVKTAQNALGLNKSVVPDPNYLEYGPEYWSEYDG